MTSQRQTKINEDRVMIEEYMNGEYVRDVFSEEEYDRAMRYMFITMYTMGAKQGKRDAQKEFRDAIGIEVRF